MNSLIRNGFSGSVFWSDVVKHEVTGICYIGEVARFLLGKFKWLVHSFEISNLTRWVI